MNKLQKIITGFFVFLGGLFTAFSTFALDADSIVASASGVLDTTVSAITEAGLGFITTNLPIIVVLGVCVGLVFWLLRKAIKAIRGRT